MFICTKRYKIGQEMAELGPFPPEKLRDNIEKCIIASSINASCIIAFVFLSNKSMVHSKNKNANWKPIKSELVTRDEEEELQRSFANWLFLRKPEEIMTFLAA